MWQHWYAQPTSAPAGQSPSPTPTHHVLSDEPLTSILPTRTSQRWQRDESYQLVIVSVTTILVGLETRCRTCSSAFARPRADQPEQMASPEHRQGDHSCVHHRAEIRPAHLRAAAQRYSRDKCFRYSRDSAQRHSFARDPWLLRAGSMAEIPGVYCVPVGIGCIGWWEISIQVHGCTRTFSFCARRASNSSGSCKTTAETGGVLHVNM